jgi:hypothetical protein
VTEIKTVPYVSLSHPSVERLIGTVRREYLDRILFWTSRSGDEPGLNLVAAFEDQKIEGL